MKGSCCLSHLGVPPWIPQILPHRHIRPLIFPMWSMRLQVPRPGISLWISDAVSSVHITVFTSLLLWQTYLWQYFFFQLLYLLFFFFPAKFSVWYYIFFFHCRAPTFLRPSTRIHLVNSCSNQPKHCVYSGTGLNTESSWRYFTK